MISIDVEKVFDKIQNLFMIGGQGGTQQTRKGKEIA